MDQLSQEAIIFTAVAADVELALSGDVSQVAQPVVDGHAWALNAADELLSKYVPGLSCIASVSKVFDEQKVVAHYFGCEACI